MDKESIVAVFRQPTALVQRFLANSAWQRGSGFFRKLAGLCIGALGIYFISQPLMSIV